MGVGRRPFRLHSVASLSFLVARYRDFTGVLDRRLLYAGRCCVVCQRVKQPAAAVIQIHSVATVRRRQKNKAEHYER
jgi:hypothetical protein